MKKLLICAVAALPLALAACGETYDAVNGTDQVLVYDAGDKIDGENIRLACAQKGEKVTRVQWVGNGKTQALVSCAPR